MDGRADLHIHTNFSDGFYSPLEIVSMAKKKGLETISITDHDSVSALPQAINYGREIGIEVITGVEISSDVKDREIHILGYFIDIESEDLERYLIFFREERLKRAVRIVKKLNTLGLPLRIEDVLEKSKNSAVGRPHIAHAMLENKLVSSFYEAFNKYIGNNGPAYEKKVHLSPQSAFKIINDAGGLSFIAHPGYMEESLLKELIDDGADGIEVIHSSHSKEQVSFYRGIVNEYFLLESGGSDFHGGKREDDKNFGRHYTKQSTVEAMRKRLLRNTA